MESAENGPAIIYDEKGRPYISKTVQPIIQKDRDYAEVNCKARAIDALKWLWGQSTNDLQTLSSGTQLEALGYRSMPGVCLAL